MSPEQINELFNKWFNEEKKNFPPMPEIYSQAIEVFARHAFAQGMLETLKNIAEKYGIDIKN